MADQPAFKWQTASTLFPLRGDVLNVRRGPSTEFDVIGELEPGSRGVLIPARAGQNGVPCSTSRRAVGSTAFISPKRSRLTDVHCLGRHYLGNRRRDVGIDEEYSHDVALLAFLDHEADDLGGQILTVRAATPSVEHCFTISRARDNLAPPCPA